MTALFLAPHNDDETLVIYALVDENGTPRYVGQKAPEHRESIGRGGRGLIRSPESRARLSASKTGELNPMSRAKRAERARAKKGGDAL